MESLIGIWDYLVIVIMLIISVAIGLYYKFTGNKQSTVREYLFADHSMSAIPTAISLSASYLSGSIILAMSADVYRFGFILVNIIITYPICAAVISTHIIPIYYEHQVSTPFEYLNKRFGYKFRIITSIMYCLQVVFYMGVVLYGPVISVEALIGIDEITAISIIGGTCIFYSTLGGMKAVITADVFQAILMFAAVITVITSAIYDNGGVGELWGVLKRGKRLNNFIFDFDPTVTFTTFSTILCGGIIFMNSHVTSQTQVQRYLAVKDLKTAQRALWLSTILTSLFVALCSISGLATYAKYHDCDPVKDGRIKSPDQILPLYISEVLNEIPGLSGLMVAGIFSGSISTLSSVVNGLSAITITDYIKPLYQKFYGEELSERVTNVLVKIFVVVYGVICLLSAFMAKYFDGLGKAVMEIFGAIGGPLLGIFLLGMFTTTANEMGTMVGFLTGLSITFWMTFGGPKPPLVTLALPTEGCSNITSIPTIEIDTREYFWLYRVSYLYIGVIGLIITINLGYCLSLIINYCVQTRRVEKRVNKVQTFDLKMLLVYFSK